MLPDSLRPLQLQKYANKQNRLQFLGASRVGKKLLATGNGRCNLTNIHASAKHYYGDTRLIEAILRTYPPQRVIQYFEEIGLLCKEESEGRIYPYSLQASSVLDVLRFNAEELQVEIICDCPIHNIQSKNGIFILENHQQQTFIADKVILATGGKASASNWDLPGTDILWQNSWGIRLHRYIPH